MNSAERQPNTQEQPEPAAEKQPVTLEQHTNAVRLEVAGMDARAVDARLEAVQQQHDMLQERLKAESEGKSTLGSYISEAKRKLGLLNEQQKADDTARKKMEVTLTELKRRRIELGPIDSTEQDTTLNVEVQVDDAPEQAPAFQSADGISDNQAEADFFATGDRMNATPEKTRVQFNDTPAHRELANKLARKQLEIIQAHGDKNAVAKIEAQYTPEIQQLMETIRTQQDNPAPAAEKAVSVEAGGNAHVGEDEMATQLAREVMSAEAQTTQVDTQAEEGHVVTEEDGGDAVMEEDGGDAVIEDDTVEEAMPEAVVGEAEPAQEAANDNVAFDTNAEAAADPVNEHIAKAKEAHTNVNEAVQQLEKDREALVAQLNEWGLEALTKNTINQTRDSFMATVQEMAAKKGWTQKPTSLSLIERVSRLLFVEETPAAKPDVQTIVKTLMRLRNTDRAIQYEVTPRAEEPLNDEAAETSAQRINRRLKEGTQEQKQKPDNVLPFPGSTPRGAETAAEAPTVRARVEDDEQSEAA